jgi:hypothetical protein
MKVTFKCYLLFRSDRPLYGLYLILMTYFNHISTHLLLKDYIRRFKIKGNKVTFFYPACSTPEMITLFLKVQEMLSNKMLLLRNPDFDLIVLKKRHTLR